MYSLLLWRHVRVSHLLAVSLCGLLVSLPLYAASNGAPLSLDAATRLAVQRAPQVQAQVLRADAARDDAVRAGRLPDPQLTAGISSLPATGPQAFSAAADGMTMRTVGLMQVIPSGAQREAEKSVARSDVRLSAADVVTMRLAVKRAAAGAWVSLWAAERERKLLNDLRDQSALAVKVAKAQLAGGAGNATDVLAARAATVELDNRVTAADADIAAARAMLRRWIGDQAGNLLAEAPDFSALPVSPAGLLDGIDRQGPLLGWTAREDQAQAKLELAKAGKRPDWSVGLMYGSRIHLPDMIGIEVGVSLPLFPGNRQDRDISARYAERAAVRAEHEAARRAQREAVSATLAKWQGDGRQVATFRDKLLPLAADRSRTALAAYRGGGSLQPWLEARRDEIDTRIAYAKALATWGAAWTQLAYLIPDRDAPKTNNLPELLP
jgi:outer membrane protein TolC